MTGCHSNWLEHVYTVYGYGTPMLLRTQSVREKICGRIVGGKFVSDLNW